MTKRTPDEIVAAIEQALGEPIGTDVLWAVLNAAVNNTGCDLNDGADGSRQVVHETDPDTGELMPILVEVRDADGFELDEIDQAMANKESR